MAVLQATLGDLVLGAVDSMGVDWRLKAEDGIQGWESAQIRTQITQREADHGAWQGSVYLGERIITLTGTITAPSRAVLDDAKERLLAAASLTDTVLTVSETIPKQAVVRRSGAPLVTRITDRVATYSVMMTAGDPRRYSTTLQTGSTGLPVETGGLTLPFTLPVTVPATSASGAIIAINAGTFATRPLLTLTGPVGMATITVQYGDGTYAVLSYGDQLLAGEQLVLDCDAHTAILQGTASRRRYVSGTWPEFPPGTVRVEFRAPFYSAGALLTASWRSAWI